MQFTKKEAAAVHKALQHWQDQQQLDSAKTEQLKNSLNVVGFDWGKLARYTFWAALACLLIAITSALADDLLIQLFETIFAAPLVVQASVCALIALNFYRVALKRRTSAPHKTYSNEAWMMMGIIFTAIATGLFAELLSTGSNHFSLIVLFLALLYGALGLWFPSVLVWVTALLTLCAWMGLETGYVSGWGAYYLGMNYPLRYVFFGILMLLGANVFFAQFPQFNLLQRSTRIVSLLCIFIALWLMSIFGNYGDGDSWYRVSQSSLFGWALLFSVAAMLAIVHGIYYDDGMTRGFGIVFLGINLYTRYFEYFWHVGHKAIFFAVLGFSLWLIGKHAEKIWNIQRHIQLPHKP